MFFFYFSSIKNLRSEVNNFLPAWFDIWIILQIRINHLCFIFYLKFNDSPCFILIQWYFFTLMLPYRNGFCFCLVSQVYISSCSDTELMFKWLLLSCLFWLVLCIQSYLVLWSYVLLVIFVFIPFMLHSFYNCYATTIAILSIMMMVMIMIMIW